MLVEIMNMLYDVRNEVHNYDEDTQTQLQELDFEVQTITEWCEQVSQVFNVKPPFLPTNMHAYIPIPIPLAHGDISQIVHSIPSQQEQGYIV